jgi:GNAT superfamily N-acetyltransferase
MDAGEIAPGPLSRANRLVAQIAMPIRPLDGADLPAIRTLAAAAAAEGFRFVDRWLAELDAAHNQFETPTTCFLGVALHGHLVAIGGVTPDPYAADERVGRLRHLYVSGDVRRQGVGRTLVRALEGWAQGVYTQLRLRTDTSAAAHFYEHLGYRRVEDSHATHACTLVHD